MIRQRVESQAQKLDPVGKRYAGLLSREWTVPGWVRRKAQIAQCANDTLAYVSWK